MGQVGGSPPGLLFKTTVLGYGNLTEFLSRRLLMAKTLISNLLVNIKMYQNH